MATHSSVLAWRIPTDRGAWWAAVYRVAKSQTQLKRLSMPAHRESTVVTHSCSVQFSRSVVSDSLQLHELQHARPPCPSPIPRVYPNSFPPRPFKHLTISSFVVPFSSCLQYFPTSGHFQMSQLFESGGQKIGVSASTSVPTMNTQD